MAELSYSCISRVIKFHQETGRLTWLETGTDVTESIAGKGYAQVFILGKKIYAHRVAWLLSYGKWPDGQIDHINGDKRDNRISNLADVDGSKNQRNKTKRVDNRSGVNGVYFDRRKGKWAACMKIEVKTKHLGAFSSIEEAAAARLAANELNSFTARHGK